MAFLNVKMLAVKTEQMKKYILSGLKISGALLVLVLIIAIAIPVLFKDKIRTAVEKSVDETLNAKVTFGNYSIGLFRHFPKLTFTLDKLTVEGEGDFAGDTLASVGNFSLVFNLASLFGKGGYEVESVIAGDADIRALVLKNGKANWDIMADTASSETVSAETPSGMKIVLRSAEIKNSKVRYTDYESDLGALLDDVNMRLSGDMTASQTDLRILMTAGQLTYEMEGVRYLNKAVLNADLDLLADLDKYIFTFRNSNFSLNELKVDFLGTVEMPADDITTDIEFSAGNSSFKSLLSLIPAVYMNEFKDLRAEGTFNMKGSAKGVYSDADSTLPDVSLDIEVRNGLVSYPSLPDKISDINFRTVLFYDGKNTDGSTVLVDPFSMSMAGNRFSMMLSLKTPVSDPDFRTEMNGKIDLSSLARSLPLDSIKLSGLLDMSLKIKGKMSQFESGSYSNAEASGKLSVRDFSAAMSGYPAIAVQSSDFAFTPAWATLTDTKLTIGSASDFALEGRIGNYIPYFLGDGTIKGELRLRSNIIDANEIMASFSEDTVQASDSETMKAVSIPRNIDFTMNASASKLRYALVEANDISGKVTIRDGVMNISDARLGILGGNVGMNAAYDTRDTLKPFVKADFTVSRLGIKDAFAAFNTVRKLAPAAKGMDGRVNMKLSYESALGSDLMPVLSTVSGGGALTSDQVTLVSSQTFDMIKKTLNLGENYTNTFRDIALNFKIAGGRVIVSPFNVKTGNLKMNIGGDHGLDQTLNYIVKTEIPRSDLGGSVNAFIDNLTSQASAFGFAFKPGDILKVNLKVGGTFSKPLVTPFFGSAAPASTGGTTVQAIQQAVSGAVDAGRDKTRLEAEKQAAQLLQEAGEKAELLKSEAAKAADAVRKEADAQAKKLIDDAATKGTLAQIGARKGAETLRATADKKATQLVNEAEIQSNKLIEEARKKGEELTGKI